MATKWKKTYTDISNVNGGNEYETGDHITKETVNVALNNTAYLQQTKVTAESNKGLVTQRFLDGVDLNTVLANGFYGCNGACTNKPNENGPGQMLVINRGDNWIGQFYINMNQESKAFSNRVHTRGYDNSKKVWSPWKQIDNDPSLYNLGAYDTYVDNGDGTTTITRQTGYWNSNNATVNVAESYHYTNGMRVQYDKVSNIDSGEGEGKAKSNWAYGFEMISKPSNINYNSTAIWLGFPYIFVNGKADLTSALEYINKNPVSIEYKLATPYTETIITGVPQITLDKQGCEWLRSEWEKGLNLFETQMEIKLTAGSEQWRNRKITGLVVGKAYTLYAFDNNTYQGYEYQALPEYHSFKNRAYTFVASAETKEIRVGANTLSQNLDFTTQIMLIEGAVTPTKFSPYNSAYHITNEQADLLSDEEEKTRNLLDENIFKFTNNYGINLGYCELKAKTTYCLSLASTIPGSQIKIIPSTSTQSILIANGDYSFQKQGTFTPTQDYNGVLVLAGTYTDATIPSWAMLNRGSAALPYAAYNGSIVHEKQLSLQAPSMGHKVANECMMNVTGEYYNNSSSDVYILLGDIKRAYKEARDGGFIISGTIGQYYYTQQAQINAVAYWRDKVKWKGLYTQDNSDGNFNNVVDLIITTTNKIYLVIKVGQFGQYNLQLQGKTIKYTGDVLDTIDGSIASTFSQSEAINLTALDTSLSDKLEFIDNNAITDPDGNGNYKIDNNYIYDEELATNGVDYTPFDGSSSYDSQSGINQDFYKQIKTNKEKNDTLSNRNLYHTTITHGYNTTFYGQNTGEFFEVTIFTSDDKTGYNTAGTAWTILRDYLNNNGYTLGNVANWITSNQVYPCNGQLLKYSSSGSVSLTYNIYGVSYNNGKFYVHYYTNTNAYGTSELSYPDSYWKVKSTKIF